MSLAAAGVLGGLGLVGSLWGADKAADASKDAAGMAAAQSQAGLDYTKSLDAMPVYMRDQAANILAGWYGMNQYNDPYAPGAPAPIYSPGDQSKLDYIQGLKEKIAGDTGGSLKYQGERMSTGAAITRLQQLEKEAGRIVPTNAPQQGQQGDYSGQQAIIDGVMNSPFYQQNIQQGEEAIARNAMMTGGMRGGNIQEGMAQNSQNVLQDLTYQQLNGLQGFMNPQLNTGGINQGYSNVGNAAAGGQIGSANATQAGFQGAMDMIGTIGGAYIGRPQGQQTPAAATPQVNYMDQGGGNMAVNPNTWDYSTGGAVGVPINPNTYAGWT